MGVRCGNRGVEREAWKERRGKRGVGKGKKKGGELMGILLLLLLLLRYGILISLMELGKRWGGGKGRERVWSQVIEKLD